MSVFDPKKNNVSSKLCTAMHKWSANCMASDTWAGLLQYVINLIALSFVIKMAA